MLELGCFNGDNENSEELAKASLQRLPAVAAAD